MSSNNIVSLVRSLDPRRINQAAEKVEFANINDVAKAKKAKNAGLFDQLAEQMGIKQSKAANSSSAARAMASIEGKDIIAQVMGAADPQKVQTAVAKLESLGGDGMVVQPAGVTVADNSKDNARAKAMQKLEGVLLGNVLEAMMPKGDSEFYGGGTAGDMWRGFQVSQIADSMAERGVLNLDELGTKAKQQTNTVSGVSQWPYFQSRPITSFAS